MPTNLPLFSCHFSLTTTHYLLHLSRYKWETHFFCIVCKLTPCVVIIIIIRIFHCGRKRKAENEKFYSFFSCFFLPKLLSFLSCCWLSYKVVLVVFVNFSLKLLLFLVIPRYFFFKMLLSSEINILAKYKIYYSSSVYLFSFHY